MKYLLFIFPLFGSVQEPWRLEFFSGYRLDHIHWHLQTPGEPAELTYSEEYKDTQFWENGMVLKAICRDLTFFLKGSYAAFGKGTLQQRYDNLLGAGDLPNFDFSTSGWAADATGYFGYSVDLTADRLYKVILTPMF